jgi:galactoside O-acetyltransferase
MGFLSKEKIVQMGFGQVGENVFLSDKASYYNCSKIVIGDHVRVDDFCVLSAGIGGIAIGNYVHIAAFSSLIGSGRIILSDYCGLSSRVSVYSSSDDYTGFSMTNPMVPEEFTNVHSADVTIGRHVIIGSGSVIMPGVVLEEGVAVGALSLVSEKCEAFGIYVGVPAKRIRERSRDLLDLEKKILSIWK